MLDHFIAKNATAHKVNSYYRLAVSYCTFYVEKHSFRPWASGPGGTMMRRSVAYLRRQILLSARRWQQVVH